MLNFGMTQSVPQSTTERSGVTRYSTKGEAAAGLSPNSALTPESMKHTFRDAMAFYEDVHYSIFAANLAGQEIEIALPKDVFSAEFCVKWSGNDDAIATVQAYQEDGVTLAQSEFKLSNAEQVTHNFGRQVSRIIISLPPTPNSTSGSFKVSNAMSYRGYRKTRAEDAQYFEMTSSKNTAAKGFSVTGRYGSMNPMKTNEGYEWVRLCSLGSKVQLLLKGDTSLNGRTVIVWANGINAEFTLDVDGVYYSAMSYNADLLALIDNSSGSSIDIQMLFL